jgi:hypothetical protein
MDSVSSAAMDMAGAIGLFRGGDLSDYQVSGL